MNEALLSLSLIVQSGSHALIYNKSITLFTKGRDPQAGRSALLQALYRMRAVQQASGRSGESPERRSFGFPFTSLRPVGGSDDKLKAVREKAGRIECGPLSG